MPKPKPKRTKKHVGKSVFEMKAELRARSQTNEFMRAMTAEAWDKFERGEPLNEDEAAAVTLVQVERARRQMP